MKEKKILAVDDEPDTLAFYSEVLEDYDFLPILASNGVEGLQKARDEKPDLILLDIMMPEKGGIKVFRELKNDPDLQDIPVIIITGISEQVDFRTLLDRPATRKSAPEGHLPKPMKAQVLIDEIHKVLKAKADINKSISASA